MPACMQPIVDLCASASEQRSSDQTDSLHTDDAQLKARTDKQRALLQRQMQDDLAALEGQLAALDSELTQRESTASLMHRQLAAVKERWVRQGSLSPNAGTL